MQELGNRFNAHKQPWHLLMWDAVSEVVSVCKFGCTKYGPRNWEKGLYYQDTFASAQRHLLSWYGGVRLDPESGLHHLAHSAWNVLALLAFELRGRSDLDDRPKPIVK